MNRFWLEIARGPGKGDRIDLDEEKVIIGRHPEVDLNINEPEVSRRHSLLFKKRDDYFIEDLGSMNGTVVNSRAISSAYRLRDKSRIDLGANVSLVFYKEEMEPEISPEEDLADPIPETEHPPEVQVTEPEIVDSPEEFEEEPKKKRNMFAWGCFGVLVVLVLVVTAALFYIDSNYLWCDVFGQWLPGCW